jgi:polysaccharide deacetylase family protein (PEP-CTERM system associated)
MVVNALTIDFEDWYHGLTSTSADRQSWSNYESRIEEPSRWLLAELDKRSLRATFFILGVVAREHPALVRAVADAGHEIGLHGDVHRFIRSMSREEFRRDLILNKTAVEQAAGRPATCFRAPCFSISEATPWLWEELASAQISLDSSVFPVRTPLYGLPSAPRWPFVVPTLHGTVAEVPMSTIRIAGANLPFSGGFYFRTLPYAIIRASVRALNASGYPAVFYFHPWEFDQRHPRPARLAFRERFSHYGGLSRARHKFSRLLDEFRPGPLSELPRGAHVIDRPLQASRLSLKLGTEA